MTSIELVVLSGMSFGIGILELAIGLIIFVGITSDDGRKVTWSSRFWVLFCIGVGTVTLMVGLIGTMIFVLKNVGVSCMV